MIQRYYPEPSTFHNYAPPSLAYYFFLLIPGASVLQDGCHRSRQHICAQAKRRGGRAAPTIHHFHLASVSFTKKEKTSQNSLPHFITQDLATWTLLLQGRLGKLLSAFLASVVGGKHGEKCLGLAVGLGHPTLSAPHNRDYSHPKSKRF